MPDPDFKDIPDEMLENMAKGSARGVVMDVPFAGTGNPSAPSATPLSPTVQRSNGPMMMIMLPLPPKGRRPPE
jgi:hypothetical protein